MVIAYQPNGNDMLYVKYINVKVCTQEKDTPSIGARKTKAGTVEETPYIVEELLVAQTGGIKDCLNTSTITENLFR